LSIIFYDNDYLTMIILTLVEEFSHTG
jgi:hypothetical protein